MTQNYWDQRYQGLGAQPLADEYQAWIDPQVLAQVVQGQALDLGCGLGLDSRFLRQQGFTVRSVDQSREALAGGQKLGYINTPVQARLDNLDPQLFSPQCFDFIVASLSLHYFPHDKTRQIINRVCQWLKPGGVFYARINSLNDNNFGAANADQQGCWFCPEQGLKVFYSPATLQQLMVGLGELHIQEKTIYPYGKAKRVLECWFRKE